MLRFRHHYLAWTASLRRLPCVEVQVAGVDTVGAID
eukprot:SAG31_NODE_42350_length_272_cov_0.595376_1_plen_35_part_10